MRLYHISSDDISRPHSAVVHAGRVGGAVRRPTERSLALADARRPLALQQVVLLLDAKPRVGAGRLEHGGAALRPGVPARRRPPVLHYRFAEDQLCGRGPRPKGVIVEGHREEEDVRRGAVSGRLVGGRPVEAPQRNVRHSLGGEVERTALGAEAAPPVDPHVRHLALAGGNGQGEVPREDAVRQW